MKASGKMICAAMNHSARIEATYYSAHQIKDGLHLIDLIVRNHVPGWLMESYYVFRNHQKREILLQELEGKYHS